MNATARRRLGRVLGWVLVVAVAAAGLALIVVPKATGSRPLTVLSGSMSGTYEIGDVVIVRPVDTDELHEGDVITFQPISDNPALTTHRIQAISYGSEGRQFVTRGDANGAVDPEPIKAEQVMGQVWYSVPFVGHASLALAGDWARTALDVLALGFLLYGGWFLSAGVAERVRDRRNSNEATA